MKNVSSSPLFALLLVLLVGAGNAQDQAPDREGMLYRASWKAGALGRSVSGGACWVRGEDRCWRLEISLTSDVDVAVSEGLQRLLERDGEGWTFTQVGPEAATRGRWGEEWHEMNSLQARWIEQLLSLLEATFLRTPGVDSELVRKISRRRAGSPRPRWWTTEDLADEPEVAHYQLEDAEASVPVVASGDGSARPGGAFRNSLTSRGRGRGGAGEILRIERRPELMDETVPVIRVSSSRRLGVLDLQEVVARTVSYPVVETFLPLWPLKDLLNPDPQSRDKGR